MLAIRRTMDYKVYYLCGSCDDKHAYNDHPGFPDVMNEACSHSFHTYMEDVILQSYVAAEEDELAGEEAFEFLTQEVSKVRAVPKVEFISKCHICKEHVFPDLSNRTDDGLFQAPEWCSELHGACKYTLMPPNIDMQFRTYPIHKHLPNSCTGTESYPFTKIIFEVRHQECARKVYPNHVSHLEHPPGIGGATPKYGFKNKASIRNKSKKRGKK